MSDDLITIKSNLRQVQNELAKVAKKCGTPAPALRRMGTYLVYATDQRFSKQVDPKGHKWRDLKKATWKRKKNSKILTESTKLRDGISAQLQDADTLLVGSDSPYGAIHQLGGSIEQKGMALHLRGKGRNTRFSKADKADRGMKVNRTIKMPARPFLGVSTADEEELLAICGDYLLQG